MYLQWLHVVRCMKVEAEWQRSQHLPTFEEYMESGMVSLGQGATVMSALFLIGEKLPEGVVELEEYDEMFRLMGTCGRLLNDIRGIEVLSLIFFKILLEDRVHSHLINCIFFYK